MKKWLLAISVFTINTVYAQTGNTETIGTKSGIQEVKLEASISLMQPISNLNPLVQTSGIYHQADNNVKPAVMPQNQNYVEDREGKAHFKTDAETPTIFKSFSGYNDYQYTPPDNSIAVSSTGDVISAMNCNYRIFTQTGKLVKFSSFYDLFKVQFPGLKGIIYDPRVTFDAESDRFILVVLYQNVSDSSRILIMFSKTADPRDGWNLYSIPGNVLNKGQWTDYPAIAVNKKELIITGNMFSDSRQYKEPMILQINKEDGYDGKSLRFQTWSGIIDASGGFAFSLVPARGGLNENTGPGIFLVSTTINSGNRINLYNITGDMDDPNTKLTRYSVQLPFTYYSPGVSTQKGSTSEYLNTGDCRMKEAFILNDVIHFVFTTLNSTNFSAIVYGRLDVNTKQLNYKIFGQDQLNYTYPAVASLAQKPEDKSVIIVFERAGSSLYPEINVVYCNNDMTFSNSVVVQQGSSFVNILTDKVERWGDYTGIARNVNSTDIFISGCYGKSAGWTTHIARVGLESLQTGIKPAKDTSGNHALVYPNPVQDIFSVTFSLRNPGPLNISLFDMQGRKIEILYNNFERAGDKKFTFNPSDLAKGVYMLKTTVDGKELFTRKIVR